MNIYNPLHTAAALIVSGAISSTAFAQSTPAADSSTKPMLEEILVTAQKRTENLQDVPIAVSAINAKQIDERYSRDVSELESMAPNLIIDPLYGAAAASIAIRGLQLDDGEKSFDPAVAVYLDGVYLATNTGALLNTFDADSVEVLRGPQGTLFGRNTIGGLIQIRRAEPTGEFGGKVIATYGSYNEADVKGLVNLPSLFDNTLSTKFSIVSLNNGGYFYNVTRNEREGNTSLIQYSGAVKFQPSEALKWVVNYDHIEDNSPTRPVTSLSSPGQLFCAAPGDPGCGEPASDSAWHLHPTTAIPQPQFSRTDSIIANGDFKLDPHQDLVTVLGYRIIHEDSLEKFDGVEPNFFYTVRPQLSKQWSAEQRYQADFGTLKAVVGGYYFHSFYHIQQQTFFFGGEVPAYETYQNEDNYAGFAQVDWAFIDNWNLSLGARYSKEWKAMCAGSATGLPSQRVLLAAFGDCAPNIEASSVYEPNATNTLTGQVFRQTGDRTFSSATPKVTVSYSFDTEPVRGMGYATFSKGNRSGGFNGRSTSPFSMGPYNPENVTNYEVGLKSEWLDHRLQANITAFDLEYKNMQQAVVFPDPVAVTVTIVQNVSAARVRGLESEFKYLPVEGWTLGLNFSSLDSHYLNYTAPGPNLDPATAAQSPYVIINKNGFHLDRAPPFSADFNARYAFGVGSGKLALMGDYNWKDHYYIIENTLQPAGPNPGYVPAFGLLNASIEYEMPNWTVSFFGKNLTNVHYFQHVLDVGTNYGGTPTSSTPVPIAGLFTYGTMAPPITWGIEGQYRF